MKNLTKLVLSALALVMLISCGKDQQAVVPQKENITSKDQAVQIRNAGPVSSIEEVEALALQETYQLSDAVYQEFMGSLVFQEASLRTVIYEGVEDELNDQASVAFWSNFGVVLDRHVNLEIAYNELAYQSTHEGYKSKGPRDCKQRRRWICLLGSADYSPDGGLGDDY